MDLSIFVEHQFLHMWSTWPLAVATEGGRYLLTCLVVTPGNVVNCLFVMALIHVEGHGIKNY